MQNMKERLAKFLIMLLLAPLAIVVLILGGVFIALSPLIAFIDPERIKLK